MWIIDDSVSTLLEILVEEAEKTNCIAVFDVSTLLEILERVPVAGGRHRWYHLVSTLLEILALAT